MGDKVSVYRVAVKTEVQAAADTDFQATTQANSSSIYRVAVASTDGLSVNQHYGRAEIFYIYYVDDNEGYDLLEKRQVIPVCMDGSHSQKAMQESVKAFDDCRYLIASRIGSAAQQALSAQGITSMEMPGPIDDAILRVWKYNQIQGLFN